MVAAESSNTNTQYFEYLDELLVDVIDDFICHQDLLLAFPKLTDEEAERILVEWLNSRNK